MNYDNVTDYLSSFIDCEEKNENFDYDSLNNDNPENFKNELHKFNHLYNCFFFSNNRLLFMINNYEISLKKEDLSHLMKLYIFYKKNNMNNSYLLADFLLSYFNTITNKEYAKNVSGFKTLRKDFKSVLIHFNEVPNLWLELCNDSFNLYNLIIDYGRKQTNFYYGDMIEKICINLRYQKDKKQKLIVKMLEHEIAIFTVIEYDEEIENNYLYYENYIRKLLLENTHYQYPSKLIIKLDRVNKLKKDLLNSIINDFINKINEIHDKSNNDASSFMDILSNVDQLINIINELLNNLKSLNEIQIIKLRECMNNILYIKRIILSDDKKIISQMQEFEYKTTIPNKKINTFVNVINNHIGRLFIYSCGNFIKRLEDSINVYAEYPISYIFNSYSIDTENQVYYKSDEKIENSIFKKYYDLKGKDYTKSHPELLNKLNGDYYNQMLKHMQKQFISEQYLIISMFDIKEGERSLMNKLISKGHYLLINDYVILAMNVIQIEHMVIEILKNKKMDISKDGLKNLNDLAEIYVDNPIYFNGLMYINYILYEKKGLNIRNNISHGNYFNKKVEVELLTTYCSIMFLNNLCGKERENNENKEY